MSLDEINKIFGSLYSCKAWQLQLLSIIITKKHNIEYFSRRIVLMPIEKLNEFTSNLITTYIDTKKGKLLQYSDVTTYDGTAVSTTIYELSSQNHLILKEFESFITTVSIPDNESDPLETPAQAYILSGIININDEEVDVKLISMQNPIINLKHKFLYDKGTFEEIKNKVLSLRLAIDVMIVNRTVYFFSMTGEKLFNMERSYKIICKERVEEIIRSGIITDNDAFKNIAITGFNARRFISFNTQSMHELMNSDIRKQISNKFIIPLSGDRFDTNKEGVCEKLIKLLCNKGMLDPFENTPVEVTGIKKWK